MAPDVARIWRRLEVFAADHRARKPDAYTLKPELLKDRTLSLDGLTLDWSLQRLDDDVLEALVELSNVVNLQDRLRQQFEGEVVNPTEQRAALHSAMRDTPTSHRALRVRLRTDREELTHFAINVLNGHTTSYCGAAFTDVLHIGIGGSHLGQKLLSDALASTRLNLHFLSNSQSERVRSTLDRLDPAKTLAIVASKSFTTPETQQNFQSVKNWFAERTGRSDALASNLVLISSNASLIEKLPGKHFTVPEEVGGRFSVWSAMGLPVLLATGPEQFAQLLHGANLMDHHTITTPSSANAAVMLALLALWNTNFLAASSHAVLSYVAALRWLPGYLQQLEMESLGKSVTVDGETVPHHTTGVIWGGEETDGQHAWHQWLHQGTHLYSADFIATTSRNNKDDSWTLANSLAQHHVTFYGHEDNKAPEKHIQGGHGSTLILLDDTNAKTIGMLLALYEHKVACLGYLWNIDPFDQWGVERGKVMAEEINKALSGTGHTLSNPLLDERVRKILPRQK
ncbi:MAG: glucose-6-phosphate isomerase [Gammaproteobacteria bacterium]|nr:glucose-6-phosphate isomerase [Gammaproteobacteria bacterium]